MPPSVTVNPNVSLAGSHFARRASCPIVVNFAAIPKQFSSTCRTHTATPIDARIVDRKWCGPPQHHELAGIDIDAVYEA